MPATVNKLFFVTSRIVQRADGYWVEVCLDGQHATARDFGPFASAGAAEQAQKDFQGLLRSVELRREEG